MESNRLRNIALTAFNLRSDEVGLVQLLALHHFFQGFGIALLTIIGQAMFLSEYPIKDLPLVYLAAAGVLVLFGRLYAWLEHNLALKRLFQLDILLMLGIALLCWAGAFWWGHGVLGIMVMIAYRLIYLIGNLEFWGLSAVLFDVRQGKRLFSLISAGDVPAKLLGYLMVSALGAKIGLHNLILLAALSFLVSLFFMFRIVSGKRGHALDHGDSHGHDDHHGHSHHREDIITRLFGPNFILALAGLSFIAVLVLTLIDFSFLEGVKRNYGTEEELAAFLGLFFAVGKGITIILKLFLSGRIIDKLGVKRSLLILPALVTVLSLLFIADQTMGFSDHTIFWIMGILMLVSEVFQYSLNGPVFLAMFQPLGEHDRLKGHTVVKGFTDALALGLAGGLLYLLTQWDSNPIGFLRTVTYGITALALLWLVAVAFVNRRYLDVLKSAVRRRFLDGSQMQIADVDSLKIVKEKLESDYPEEVIYALELLRNADRAHFDQAVAGLLSHPSPEVRFRVMSMLESPASPETLRGLESNFDESGNTELQIQSIRTYCLVASDPLDLILPYLESEKLAVKAAAITGLMETGQIEAIVLGGQSLLALLESDVAEERLAGAGIMGELHIRKFYQPLMRLLKDPDERVVSKAIEAAGKVRNPALLTDLIELLPSDAYRGEVLRQLSHFGDEATSRIVDMMESGMPDLNKTEFLAVLAHIHTDKSKETLLRYSSAPHTDLRGAALRALDHLAFESKDKKHWENEMFRRLPLSLHLRVAAENVGKEENPLLHEALVAEANEQLDRILLIAHFIYPRESLKKALDGLRAPDRDKVANALEILDNLIPNRITDRLLPILQNGLDAPDVFRSAGVPGHFSDMETVAEYILNEGHDRFSRWTIAMALRFAERSDNARWHRFAEQYGNDNTLLLREIAGRMMTRSKDGSLNEKKQMDAPHLLVVEKVIVLRSTELFSETPEEILVDLAEIMAVKRFDADETIVAKGDPGDFMFVIYSGEVRIHDGEHVFGTLGRREFFGELALLDPAPRSATVTANEPSLLLRLDQAAFIDLMEERLEVARGILKVLARRIREDNRQIARLRSQVAEV